MTDSDRRRSPTLQTPGSKRTSRPDGSVHAAEPHVLAVDQLLANRHDVGNADWFVYCAGKKLRYRHDRQCWLVYDGEVAWREDRDGEVMRLAERAIREFMRLGATHGDARAVAEWAKSSLNKRRLDAMIDLARHKLPWRSEDSIESDPMLLPVKNGVVDLRDGTIRPARQEDYILRVGGVAYDKDARCPQFLAFLRRIFRNDSELILYMQRVVGYTLTGSTGEQVFFFLYGDGENGKSVLYGLTSRLLGDYAETAGVETFLQRRGDRNSTSDLARLEGARLIIAAEPDRNRNLATGLIKQITGGDAITARFQHKNEISFRPCGKLWFASNHQAPVKDTTHGFWRRVQEIPFAVIISEAERIDNLEEKLADAELPGIFNWALTGVFHWNQVGLKKPAAVIEATAAYRAEQDSLIGFLAERCEQRKDHFVLFKALFDEYNAFCEEQGVDIGNRLKRGDFGKQLSAKDFIADTGGKNHAIRRGLRLRPKS